MASADVYVPLLQGPSATSKQHVESGKIDYLGNVVQLDKEPDVRLVRGCEGWMDLGPGPVGLRA